jgi:hypothetical protein
MSGNLARRRMTKFMPADFKLIETRQPPLKDMYDEWLARIICYAFRARGQRGRSHPAGRQGFRGREQNTNIFLTAYSRSPVAQTFMIWSFDWESAWSRSPFASTELSTLVFRDHVLLAQPQEHLVSPQRNGTCGASKGKFRPSKRGDGHLPSAGHSITFVVPPFPHCPDRNSGGDMPLGPSAPGNRR